MDYEKKLREALDSVETDYEVVRWIESTFPELAESEDERIRKFLVDILSSGTWRKEWPFSPADCVAYLEKQKEQPKEELVYRLNGFMQEYIKEGKDEAEKEHRFKCYHLFWDALEDENFFEQKEQKPDDDPLDDPKFIKGFDTGREVQRIFDEQKPADSVSKEEYVKRFKALCDAYEIKLPNREYDIYHLCDDLSKLSIDSGKQKPAEWSEKDEEELSRIATERAYDEYPIFENNKYNNEWNAKRVGYKQGYEQAIRDFDLRKNVREWTNNRIKSLRPSWKPSEEQIYSLGTVVNGMEESDFGVSKNLRDLYEQLKKL